MNSEKHNNVHNTKAALKGKVGSLPSHQLLQFLASITSTQDSNPDLPTPRPADRVTIPPGHHVGKAALILNDWRLARILSTSFLTC